MSVLADLKTIYHLVLGSRGGDTHAERLESFYQGQAESYDSFRRRLLQGRSDLYGAISAPENGVWIDMGGGTGANLEHLGRRIERLKKIYVVDLCPSLLDMARERKRRRGWANLDLVEADVTTFTPEEKQADVITFSYALTMIPDWYAAIDNALRLLKPGGVIGVVDFYVSRKHAARGDAQHGWCTRTFWQTWFASDNVFLSPDHIPYLRSRFETVRLAERRAKVPYMMGLKVPYYIYAGRKPAGDQ